MVAAYREEGDIAALSLLPGAVAITGTGREGGQASNHHIDDEESCPQIGAAGLELPPQIFGVSEAMDDLQDRSRAKVIEIRIELGRPEVKKRGRRIALLGS